MDNRKPLRPAFRYAPLQRTAAPVPGVPWWARFWRRLKDASGLPVEDPELAMSLRAALSRATLASLEGGVLTLRVPDPINADVLKRDVVTVRTAIADVLGHPLDVRVVVGAGAAPPEEDGPTAEDGEDGDDLMRYALEKLRLELDEYKELAKVAP